MQEDAELFDAEKNGFNEKIKKLNDSISEKDRKITQLKADLAKANMFHKDQVCIRCGKPKKYVVANMRFCSIPCIQQVKKDLEGADKLPIV